LGFLFLGEKLCSGEFWCRRLRGEGADVLVGRGFAFLNVLESIGESKQTKLN